MNHKDLSAALAKKRGQGFELKISIQPSDEDKKQTDLAPGHPDKEEDKALMQGAGMDEIKPEHEAMESPETEGMEEALLGPMSEHDIADIKDRKPRSLMERAKQAALAKRK